ncbi:hypothetical protein GH714_029655 [Hevea brasiliensis]|uniref:AB hydrolase-1 domain-containing protein n=1 Tax=Hevea brasiliensis TaxID=3981 RepID=A0A6A6KVA1_HEVBR|nr:hypothetical protein GH714_029655 [Hevea brasiliensis]
MTGGVNRKISAASARAHTRRTKQNSSLKFPPGEAIRPPPPKTCGSPGGPPITAPRIKLRDGRHLAYKEHGVSKDVAKFKIIVVHGFNACRHNPAVANHLSLEIVEELGIYIVSFDRPGYGESDPHPKRTLKSFALDVEELADQLGLGSKFYVIGLSMGGELTWSCLKYIPHRLAGVTLLAPAINYWWPGFPANLSNEAYHLLPTPDQWAVRVAHYTPWLTYWWNTQKWFSGYTVIADNPDIFSQQDKEIFAKLSTEKRYLEHVIQQGEYESYHRDMIFAFGTWELDPMDLDNPFPNNKVSVHLWQGDEDRLVPIKLQRYITRQLPWIHYHELPGSGTFFLSSMGCLIRL